MKKRINLYMPSFIYDFLKEKAIKNESSINQLLIEILKKLWEKEGGNVDER